MKWRYAACICIISIVIAIAFACTSKSRTSKQDSPELYIGKMKSDLIEAWGYPDSKIPIECTGMWCAVGDKGADFVYKYKLSGTLFFVSSDGEVLAMPTNRKRKSFT